MFEFFIAVFAVIGAIVYAVIGLFVGVMMAPFYGWLAIPVGIFWPPFLVLFVVAQKIPR